jgi:membrane associated rhomboid family serine protease
MLFPIGDSPNFSHVRPVVNWGLIAANVLVFLLAKMQTGGDAGYAAWTLEWGFTPVAPTIETFFTSMFLHADFMHLAGNMLFLWIFGDNVEGRLGHAGYLLAYLAFGLAAVLFFRVLAPGSTIPLVGASGAIFGVEGFYFLAFGRNRVRVIYWILIAGAAEIPARVMLGISFVFNLVYMLAQGDKLGGGVAYAAHVGGFVIGLLLALALRAVSPREPEVPPY